MCIRRTNEEIEISEATPHQLADMSAIESLYASGEYDPPQLGNATFPHVYEGLGRPPSYVHHYTRPRQPDAASRYAMRVDGHDTRPSRG